MPTNRGLETELASEVGYVLAGAWANCSTIVEQNAGKSDGDRLVTRFPSTTTSCEASQGEKWSLLTSKSKPRCSAEIA